MPSGAGSKGGVRGQDIKTRLRKLRKRKHPQQPVPPVTTPNNQGDAHVTSLPAR